MTLLQRYRQFRQNLAADFHKHVDPLLQTELVRRLDDCPQHFNYTRLRHSLDVAYLSFYWARVLRWNSAETVRAALLHDLFFHEEGQHSWSLLRTHPSIAAANARQLCGDLTLREEDIIRKHMFLLTFTPPRYKEGYIVTLVDKYCAVREFAVSLFTWKIRRAVYELSYKTA